MTEVPTLSSGNCADRHRQPLIRVQDLVLERADRPLLEMSGLDIFEGEIVALIGRSGCGKSTFLSHLAGTFPARSGSVVFPQCGRDGTPRTYVSRSVQGAPLFHWLTVRQNLERAAAVRGAATLEADKVLASFAAQELADRYPGSLSGGERCRASLSQALVGNPKVLLLDEPFTGLDIAVKRFVAQNIFQVARTADACVIMVTHDLYDAVEYASRVVVLGDASPTRVLGEFPASIDAIEDIARLLTQ